MTNDNNQRDEEDNQLDGSEELGRTRQTFNDSQVTLEYRR
jgi:hypothetical protein